MSVFRQGVDDGSKYSRKWENDQGELCLPNHSVAGHIVDALRGDGGGSVEDGCNLVYGQMSDIHFVLFAQFGQDDRCSPVASSLPVHFVGIGYGNDMLPTHATQADLMVLFFYYFRDDRKRLLIFYSLASALLVITDVTLLIIQHYYWYQELWQLGMFLFIPLLLLYNGEPGSRHPFHKWFFYVFYPAHLLVLWGICFFVSG